VEQISAGLPVRFATLNGTLQSRLAARGNVERTLQTHYYPRRVPLSAAKRTICMFRDSEPDDVLEASHELVSKVLIFLNQPSARMAGRLRTLSYHFERLS